MKANTLLAAALFALSTTILALSAAPVSAQVPQQPAGDQISQLAEMVGLSDEQEAEIRAKVEEYTPRILELQQEAQMAQQELQEKAGPDYDEAEIREAAEGFGELYGEIMALQMILESSIESVFTEEQREQLEQQVQLQQQQQQQQQQQLQEQLQRQQQQGGQ